MSVPAFASFILAGLLIRGVVLAVRAVREEGAAARSPECGQRLNGQTSTPQGTLTKRLNAQLARYFAFNADSKRCVSSPLNGPSSVRIVAVRGTLPHREGFEAKTRRGRIALPPELFVVQTRSIAYVNAATATFRPTVFKRQIQNGSRAETGHKSTRSQQGQTHYPISTQLVSYGRRPKRAKVPNHDHLRTHV
jgi:hypothetical protein